jgi:phosphoribosyl-AMP cyclohydrolase / phosphoribosyl-ATP pyrophosphohydrolase
MHSPWHPDALTDTLRFDRDGLVVVVCQHAHTGEVLMVARADAEAVRRTLASGRATFYSRSRQAQWRKGETSGNELVVLGVRVDCDADTVLYEVEPTGPACHTGARSCFGADGGGVLARLRVTIEQRRHAEPADSYTARLLAAPRSHVARKVGEEAVEVITDAGGSETLVGEIADLWFHTMLLLARDGIDPLAPLAALARRQARPTHETPPPG